jgi:Methyltransferase domain
MSPVDLPLLIWRNKRRMSGWMTCRGGTAAGALEKSPRSASRRRGGSEEARPAKKIQDVAVRQGILARRWPPVSGPNTTRTAWPIFHKGGGIRMGYQASVDGHIVRPLWRRVARTLLPKRVRHRLGTWYGELGIARCPDRLHLERELIPAVGHRGGNALFIGCRPYTKRYPALLGAHGAECWTIDVDPTVARWGAPERHVTDAVQNAQDHWPPSSFDTIVLNGVFGFGLDSVRDQDAALRVSRRLLTSGGWLILGWNTDRCIDPLELPALRNQFLPLSIPGLAPRQTFPASTHVFDTFTAVSGERDCPGRGPEAFGRRSADMTDGAGCGPRDRQAVVPQLTGAG